MRYDFFITFWSALKTILLALLQVTFFSVLFAIPIFLLWNSILWFRIPFLYSDLTYFSIVEALFILQTLARIIRSAIPTSVK